MARFGNVAELATFLGKLDADYAEYAPALWQKGIKIRGSLQTSVSHIILLVMYQRGILMILKQELIQQVSCCLATLYISIHVVLGTASMWLKGLQLVAQLLEGVVTKK